MIEIDRPKFVVGEEKRFAQFTSKFNEKDKIALVSHVADLDGLASAKVINEVVSPDFIKFIDYHEVDQSLIDYLKKNKVKFLIIVDIMIKDVNFIKEVEKFAEILIIDHHTFENDFNSNRTVFLNAQGYCAAYISYYLFSGIRNIEKYDWLIASASVSDWCYKENSAWMTKVYEKYRQEFIPSIDGVKKSEFYRIVLDISRAIVYFRSIEKNVDKVFTKIGSIIFGDIDDLAKYAEIVYTEIKKIRDKFEIEKVSINDGYYFEFESKFPIKSIISTDVSESYQNKTIIILSRKNDNLEISARRQDGKIDMNKMMQELISGFEGANAGGHFKATGGYIKLKDEEEFKRRLVNY